MQLAHRGEPFVLSLENSNQSMDWIAEAEQRLAEDMLCAFNGMFLCGTYHVVFVQSEPLSEHHPKSTSLPHESHRVRIHVVLGDFSRCHFGRILVWDEHERLGKHARLPVDAFARSGRRVAGGAPPVDHGAGNRYKQRRRLTPCTIFSATYACKTRHIDVPGIGWQSKDWTSCFVGGIFAISSLTPSEPVYGVPFQVNADPAR